MELSREQKREFLNLLKYGVPVEVVQEKMLRDGFNPESLEFVQADINAKRGILFFSDSNITVSSNADRKSNLLTDESYDSCWESDGSQGTHWIQISLPGGTSFSELQIFTKDFGNYSPKTVRISCQRKRACHFFNSPRGCNKGDKCEFLHFKCSIPVPEIDSRGGGGRGAPGIGSADVVVVKESMELSKRAEWVTLLTAAEAERAGVSHCGTVRVHVKECHDGGCNTRMAAVRVTGGTSAPSSSIKTPVPTSAEISNREDKLNKYLKMHKCDVPDGAVRLAMRQDGYDSADIEDFFLRIAAAAPPAPPAPLGDLTAVVAPAVGPPVLVEQSTPASRPLVVNPVDESVTCFLIGAADVGKASLRRCVKIKGRYHFSSLQLFL
jgi:hypothetical protein